METTKNDLLNPESWAEVLHLYAGAMSIAVAMTDLEGRLMGVCHNPQPIWTLARGAKPDWGPGCLFCMDTSAPCTSAADAQRTGSMVMTRDRAGFAHIALPLFLGERHLGTLLAGQVFDHYPEPLALERLARKFDLSAQGLWNIARQQVPLSSSSLTVYGKLLLTLGQALLGKHQSAYLTRKLAATDAELHTANQELERVNSNLRVKVAELSKSNGEKGVLLQEVHHRVNNNLQIIASLLRLQADFYGDDQLAEALQSTHLRIEAMALIHGQLYEAADLRQVDFADYTARLADNLMRAYGVDRERISLAVDIGLLSLTVDQAIPAGLMLSELISNAIKYAFPDLRRGSIAIQGGLRGDRVELLIRDDGVGLSPQWKLRPRKSQGLHIVEVLSGQLHATLVQTQSAGVSGSGTTFTISFVAKILSPEPG